MIIFKIIKNQYFWLGLILLFGFGVRLYKIDSPIADWHSWRQADTAAVARNFFKEGFNPFIPKYDDMSAVADHKPGQNSPFNPHRYRFVEFPIYNSIVYFFYLLSGGVDEKLARLVSVFMSLGSTLFIFLIVKRYWDKLTAIFAAFCFAFLPYNIYFSRVILPEPTLIFFSLGMVYFVDRWIYEDKKYLYWLSVLLTAAAFLIKPTAIFYLLPLIYSYFQKEKKWWPIPKRYYLWLIPALLPFIAWRFWMSRFPEGIPASNWLLNGNHIRFKPVFWRWIIGDRFGREILTVTGTTLFFIGLLKKSTDRGGLLLHLLALSSFLYLIVFATGNVQHDYYQTLIIPALAIFLARGFTILISGVPGFLSRIWTIPFAVLFFALTFYFGWTEVKGLYQINNGIIVTSGQEADKILPKDAIVVAPYNGDTAFLYQTNRPGFPFVSLPLEELITHFGVTYYVSVNFDAKTNWVIRRYKVIEKNSKYVIVDLRFENTSFDKLSDPEPN